MEQPKVEVIKQAIKQVLEDDDVEDDNQRRLLAMLISQLEEEPAISKSDGVSDDESEEEERNKIVKELKKLKRQNFITHCLLSVMIVLTVAWQISEVSLILKVRDRVTNPFRSVGSIFKRLLNPPKPNGNVEESLIESSPINDIQIPQAELELPNIGLSLID